VNTTFFIREPKRAKQAMEDVERRYARLLASVTDYVYTVTVEQGRPVTTTHGAGCEAVTGYTSDEFEAYPFLWESMICKEDLPAVRAHTDRVLDGQKPPPLEFRLIHKNGGERWVKHTTVAHRNELGQVIAYDGLVSDITERRQAQDLLSVQYLVTRELAQASSLLDALTRVVASVGTVFRSFRWDRAVLWSLDAGANRLHCAEIWHPLPHQSEEFEVVNRKLAFARGEGMPGRVWASGTLAWIADLAQDATCPRAPYAAQLGLRGTCAFPIRRAETIVGVIELFSREAQQPDQHLQRVLATLGNQIGQFLEHREAEEQRRLSEQRLQAILDHSPAVIHLKDAEGRYLLVNRRFEQLFGVSRAEVAGLAPHDLFAQETADALRNHDLQVLAARAPMEFDETVPQNGELRTYISVKFPLLDAAGVVYALGSISTDITERKRAEDKLNRAYRELSESEAALKETLQELKSANDQLKAAQLRLIQAAKLESVGTLAAGVAHEVKNPLQTILMGLDYLDHNLKAGDSNAPSVLTDMRDAVTRASTIIRGLLEFAAPAAFELKDDDLNALIEQSLRLISGQAVASQVEVVRDLECGLPPVSMDRRKMQQVFINLFINAVQAMARGGVLSVRTRAGRCGRDLDLNSALFPQFRRGDRLVRVEVQDTGTGISEAHLAKVFDPFFTTKPVGVGSGLGLSVVKKIVDLHGGAIDIRNGPQGGALVTLVLRTQQEKVA